MYIYIYKSQISLVYLMFLKFVSYQNRCIFGCSKMLSLLLIYRWRVATSKNTWVLPLTSCIPWGFMQVLLDTETWWQHGWLFRRFSDCSFHFLVPWQIPKPWNARHVFVVLRCSKVVWGYFPPTLFWYIEFLACLVQLKMPFRLKQDWTNQKTRDIQNLRQMDLFSGSRDPILKSEETI